MDALITLCTKHIMHNHAVNCKDREPKTSRGYACYGYACYTGKTVVIETCLEAVVAREPRKVDEGDKLGARPDAVSDLHLPRDGAPGLQVQEVGPVYDGLQGLKNIISQGRWWTAQVGDDHPLLLLRRMVAPAVGIEGFVLELAEIKGGSEAILDGDEVAAIAPVLGVAKGMGGGSEFDVNGVAALELRERHDDSMVCMVWYGTVWYGVVGKQMTLARGRTKPLEIARIECRCRVTLGLVMQHRISAILR